MTRFLAAPILTAALASLNALPVALAQESATPPAAPAPPPCRAETESPEASPSQSESKWTIELHACVWYLGFSGDITLPRTAPGQNNSTNLDDLDLTSPILTPFGEATLRKDRWVVSLRGFAFGTEGDATQTTAGNIGNLNYSAGDSIASSLNVQGLELEGGYTFWRHEESAIPEGFKLRARLDGLLGVRLLNMDYDAQLAGGGSAGDSEFAAQPLIGARLSGDFYEQFSVILEISVGGQPFGDNTSYGFDIIVGGQWRPIRHVGVEIGYRSLFMGMKSGTNNDQFEFAGAGQGLYAGVTFNF